MILKIIRMIRDRARLTDAVSEVGGLWGGS
jgi:hypothetical protein